MVSRLIQGCGSLCAPDQLLRRENNGSYRFVFVPATFVDDEPETVDVEFPMVATYNDCLLAGKILETDIHIYQKICSCDKLNNESGRSSVSC